MLPTETYEDDNGTFKMKLIPCFDEQERTYLMPPQTSHHMKFYTKSTVVPSILGSRRWINIQLWSPLYQLSISNDKLD